MAFVKHHKVLCSAVALILIVFEFGSVNGENEDYGNGDAAAQSYGDYSYGTKNPEYSYVNEKTVSHNRTPIQSDNNDNDRVQNNGNQAYGAQNPQYSYITTKNTNRGRNAMKSVVDDVHKNNGPAQTYGAQNPQYGYIATRNTNRNVKTNNNGGQTYGAHNPEYSYIVKPSRSDNRVPIESTATTSRTVEPRVDTTPPQEISIDCKPTSTTINGGKPVKCAQELIFEESFDNLDVKKWSIERRFATEPDYEFNMYLDDVPEVLDTRHGFVIIKPKPTLRHFLNINQNLHSDLSLGFHCTGRIDTEDCNFRAANVDILPPLITAQLSTKRSFSFKYGRIEIRAKLPQTDWVFPQFWLQPVENTYGTKNYRSGQIRLAFSQMNGTEMEMSGGVLFNSEDPWRLERMCAKPDASDLKGSDSFHIFSLTWTESYISFAVDGREYCKIYETDKKRLPNRALLENGTPLAPFDREFYLTIGYGIGGHNDFDDSAEWQVKKPWVNFSPKAQKEFWQSIENRIDHWLEEAALKVDYVQVFSV